MVSKFWGVLSVMAAAGGLAVALHPERDRIGAHVPQQSASRATRSPAGASATPIPGHHIGSAALPPLALGTRQSFPAFSAADTFGMRYLGTYFPGLEGTTSVAVGDVTGDGRQDLVVGISDALATPGYTSRVAVFVQGPDGGLLSPVRSGKLPTSYHPPLELGNMDGDDALEMVVGHRNGITILNFGSGTFATSTITVPPNHLGDVNYDGLGLIDIDQDFRLDVVGLNYYGATVFVGNGNNGISRTDPIAIPISGPYHLRIGDVTGDGLEDMVLASSQGEQAFWVYPHNGSGFASPARYSTQDLESLPQSMTIGDFNNDHRMDMALAVHNGDDSSLRIYHQRTDGRLNTPAVRLPATNSPLGLVTGDFNNDGRTDLAENHATVSYRLQHAGGLASPAVAVPTGSSLLTPNAANPMATGDVNGDGCTDLVSADMVDGANVYLSENCTRRTMRTGGGHQRTPAGSGLTGSASQGKARVVRAAPGR